VTRSLDIYKAGGIIIRDRQVLLAKPYGNDLYLNVGGKVEMGETAVAALIRELAEECSITVAPEDVELFGSYEAPAAGHEDRWLKMDVFMIKRWLGEPVAGHEIERLEWVTSDFTIPTGSIFQHEVIPRLKAAGLID
jgi:8-oxo-dGTP pyrophosphatase MutT (NUDIX family)